MAKLTKMLMYTEKMVKNLVKSVLLKTVMIAYRIMNISVESLYLCGQGSQK